MSETENKAASIHLNCVKCGSRVAEFNGPNEGALLVCHGAAKVGFFVRCGECLWFNYYDITNPIRPETVTYAIEQDAIMDTLNKWINGKTIFDEASVEKIDPQGQYIAIDELGNSGLTIYSTNPPKTEGDDHE